MLKLFRKNHILKILEIFKEKPSPIDSTIHTYFKSHHSIGSNDRKEISEFVYQYIRWMGLIDHLCKGSLADKIDWLSTHNVLDYTNEANIPDHIRLSFPKIYYETLNNTLDPHELRNFCLASNQKAPVTIRTNLLKTTREALLEKLKDRFTVSPTKYSSMGITFHGKATLFKTEEFQHGLFEMQDEASQLACLMVDAKPSDSVLDFCCGAGGKTLGFAHKLQGHGQIYIHDVRAHALQEAKKRFNRAGIQNFQILDKSSKNWNSKKRKMDWVLVDAPCSGSGTLRRNPDQKWKFNQGMLSELVDLQRSIFIEALDFLKPDGKIVYATCSVLKEENQNQIDYFCETLNLKVVGTPLISFPTPDGMDGFFAAVMEKL